MRLYVKAKSRRSVADWLDDNSIPFERHQSTLGSYSVYFVLDRTVAQRVRREFAQRDMKITEHF